MPGFMCSWGVFMRLGKGHAVFHVKHTGGSSRFESHLREDSIKLIHVIELDDHPPLSRLLSLLLDVNACSKVLGELATKVIEMRAGRIYLSRGRWYRTPILDATNPSLQFSNRPIPGDRHPDQPRTIAD